MLQLKSSRPLKTWCFLQVLEHLLLLILSSPQALQLLTLFQPSLLRYPDKYLARKVYSKSCEGRDSDSLEVLSAQMLRICKATVHR